MIVCESGLSMSVQATEAHFCEPRNNAGPYRSVEDVFYERQERHGGKLYSVFMAPDDLAGRFFAKALSLGYEGKLVNSGARVGG